LKIREATPAIFFSQHSAVYLILNKKVTLEKEEIFDLLGKSD
jgi:hypothetical protein